MKKLLLSIIFCTLFFASFAGELYQLGTIDSMMKGYYEEVKDISEVKAMASMGLGTTTELGEVIGIDKKFYLADAKGNVKQLSAKTLTPYMTCSSFNSKISFRQNTPVNSSKEFYTMLEKKYLEGENIFYAIRVDGTFQKVDARSEDSFTGKPEPLAEWLKTHQKSFVFNNIQGTLVIYKYPQYMNGIGVGGYHAHFLSDNRKFGGHVFDFSLINGKVSIEPYYQITLMLPETDKFVKADMGSLNNDEKESIHKIETKDN
ncbi:MAG TPA: acetolactate decarboxylase [Lentisphaeria bacterium]|nr:MAG: alpha-acetolactate decarboxylase [Lentisphaerae bacterium GWF2_38_69]HBM15398.1 acetolactate decarboxylase [Lentisphaeria bacterium]